MIIWWTKKINKNERQKQLKSFERVYWESIKVSGKQKRKRWGGGLELSLRRELEAAVLSKDRAKSWEEKEEEAAWRWVVSSQ